MTNPFNTIHLIGQIPTSEKIKITYMPKTEEKQGFLRTAISVRRNYKNAGEQYYQSDLFNIIAFNGIADYIHNYVQRGMMIAITGYVQFSDYEDKDGIIHKQSATVYVDSCNIIGNMKREDNQNNSNVNNVNSNASNNNVSASKSASTQQPQKQENIFNKTTNRSNPFGGFNANK